MSRPITFITSHSLDGRTSEANQEEQRRFAAFVAAHEPQLLDFQAYVSEDNRQLKLFFVFPDGAGGPASSRPAPKDRRFRDSSLAGLLAGAAIVALSFVAVYLGSVGAPTPV